MAQNGIPLVAKNELIKKSTKIRILYHENDDPTISCAWQNYAYTVDFQVPGVMKIE